ncbi:electron transport complex subunit RsxG [Porticoccaceae bacterium]|jgi:electron transport complex protein RnfG|nr:electron transport complex subunit RsxG [Porticoccaceae bacterium]MDB3926024.1 electron transport complex subunit RsxG [Porticoccaceae bacterium]
MIFQSMGKNSLLLALFALITALILASTDRVTEDRIAESERLAAQKALFEIVPLALHNNDLLVDLQPIPEQYWLALGLDNGGDVHIARLDDQPVAAIVPSITTDGYSGDIAMIVGINFDGTVAGVRVVDHKETPGLGDKVELRKSDWILSFNGKSLNNPEISKWNVKKDRGDFDQFTGATITPKAVIHQIAKTLEYFEKDRERLLSAINFSDNPSLGEQAYNE